MSVRGASGSTGAATGAAGAGAGGATGVGVYTSAMTSESPATVGWSNSARSESSASSKRWRKRLFNCVASSELPPSSKKSSWIPTRSTPSNCRHVSATAASMSVRGASGSTGAATGAGAGGVGVSACVAVRGVGAAASASFRVASRVAARCSSVRACQSYVDTMTCGSDVWSTRRNTSTPSLLRSAFRSISSRRALSWSGSSVSTPMPTSPHASQLIETV